MSEVDERPTYSILELELYGSGATACDVSLRFTQVDSDIDIPPVHGPASITATLRAYAAQMRYRSYNKLELQQDVFSMACGEVSL